MEEGFQKLDMQRSHPVAEVGNELPFVPPFILDHIAALVGAKVIHHKLPFAAKIAVAKRCLGIERPRIGREKLQTFLMLDEGDGEMRPVEVGVFVPANPGRAARAAGNPVAIRKHHLIAVTVRSRAGA